MRKQAGLSLAEVLISAAILMIVFIVVAYPVFRSKKHPHSHTHGTHARQMALAGIMYGADHNDMIPVTTNGWLSRMQDIPDKAVTVNCPAPGTQSGAAPDAAGGRRTDAWPILFLPYLKSRGLYIDPERPDMHNIWISPAKSVTDPDYVASGATYRNQNRFPMFGMNYMFLSPLRIPKDKRGLPNDVNYAVSEGHSFYEADDPAGTVYFTESQRSMSDQTRGFFVVNAPGMWQPFAAKKNGLVAFWPGTLGSGDWVGTDTACPDFSSPCKSPQRSTNFVYTRTKSDHIGPGCNAAFLDGHVKYYRDIALADGTDYATAIAGSQGDPGSGAKIIDKKKYLWNLTDANFYGM